ncbi:zinc ribbon domain-containing protein [bacterium]|nr:MAG: zinc ribbon domain-containing protein [bacterium]
MTARCSKCGTENPDDGRFCRSCGQKFVAMAAPVETSEPGVYYCYKHKKETTRVTCGRCERPLCTKCVTVGANGVRCRDCARNKVPLHFSGMVHEMFSGLRKMGRTLAAQPYWIYIIVLLAMSVIGRISTLGSNHPDPQTMEDAGYYDDPTETRSESAPADR